MLRSTLTPKERLERYARNEIAHSPEDVIGFSVPYTRMKMEVILWPDAKYVSIRCLDNFTISLEWNKDHSHATERMEYKSDRFEAEAIDRQMRILEKEDKFISENLRDYRIAVNFVKMLFEHRYHKLMK